MDNSQTSMTEIMLWGVLLPVEVLQQSDVEYLEIIARMERPPVDWIWQEMDRVWDVLGLDNRVALQGQAISDFYSHPIWAINGVFTATDPVSVQHRDSIALFVSRLGVTHVADYGGGFGELAQSLRRVAPAVKVDIVEPYPSKLGMQRVKGDAGIQFIKEFENQYDCVIAQDVLEHVELPLELVERLVQATKPGGYLIFANCFYPVIKCHLPSTFYLRYTFAWVMKGLGLKFVEQVEGVSHALVFQRVGNVDINRFKRFAGMAKVVGPLLNEIYSRLGVIKRKVMRK